MALSTVRLDEVCQITMGQAPAGESYNDSNAGLPLIAGAGDFGAGVPKPKKFTTAPTKICAVGDIVLGIRASIGEQVIADRQYCLGRGVAGLRPSGKLNSRYLWWWIAANRAVLAARGRGATFKQVNQQDIGGLQIGLPDVAEQRRIAEILDRADALRVKRLDALALLDNFSRSIFLDMFGDPNVTRSRFPIGTIGDLLESAQYGTSAKAGATGSRAVLRMGNVTYDGRINASDLKYIDLSPHEEQKYLTRDGDLLFNRTNSVELVGKCAVYRGEPIAYAGYLVRLRTQPQNSPEYISAFLNCRYGKAVLRGMAKSIVGMANINAREVQNIQIGLPPVSLQRKFSRLVGDIDRSRAQHEADMVVIGQLLESLQQQAFAGIL